MKRAVLLIAAPLLALPLAFPDPSVDEPSADEKAVTRAVTDYVEAFYEAKPELIERGVHEELQKLGYWKNPDKGEYTDILPMTFEQAKALASRWNADGEKKDLEYEIELFEVADKTAAAKLTADWGIDYMHLIKEKDAWKIRQVLWQSHPPAKK